MYVVMMQTYFMLTGCPQHNNVLGSKIIGLNADTEGSLSNISCWWSAKLSKDLYLSLRIENSCLQWSAEYMNLVGGLEEAPRTICGSSLFSGLDFLTNCAIKFHLLGVLGGKDFSALIIAATLVIVVRKQVEAIGRPSALPFLATAGHVATY